MPDIVKLKPPNPDILHVAYHYLYLCIITEQTVYININIQIVQKAAIIIMLLTSYLKIGLYLQHP